MSRKRIRNEITPDESMAFRAMLIAEFVGNYHVGSHISKEKGGMLGVFDSLQKFTSKYVNIPPCQLFLRNPRGFSAVHPEFYKPSPSPTHIPSGSEGVRQFISSNNLNVFVHTPYTINLCANATKEIDTAQVEWAQAILNEDVYHASLLGFKGVVVHTGSLVGRSLEEGLSTMESMIRKALQFTNHTKLLLETPAGEKTSKGVCDTLFDFIAFFDRFTEKEITSLGICIDTCHVFAAGEDPLEYLQTYYGLLHNSSSSEKLKIPSLELVHLNDSSHPFGSRIDEHAPIGEGYIGFEKMRMIAEWCNTHNIPMIKEWNITL